MSSLPFTPQTVLLTAALVLISACSSSGEDEPDTINPDTMNPGTDTTPPANPPLGSSEDAQYGFFASRASDYTSGRVDRISLNDGNTVDGMFPGTLSDIAVTTDNENLYEIGRFNLDYVTRYDPSDTSIVDYQISVIEGEEVTSNPQAIAFIDDTKAYMTRRSSDKLWIIDPDPETNAEFKIGEIDLGAYDTDLPNMTDAIIVDDKLFVLVERLQELESGSQIPDKSGYLVVIDTRTDTEIETMQSPGDLKGIELLVRNPTALQYNEETGEIYVVGRGNYFKNEMITTDFHSGGIEVIDPTTYEHSLLLDDGTDDDNEGYFVDAVVINANLGYLLTYKEFTVTTLRTFNPTTGILMDTLIEGLQDVDITLIEEGPDNHLWVGINDATPGFYRIDLATGELDSDRIATELIPLDLVFISVPAED